MNTLQKYFPLIRTREELLEIIEQTPTLSGIYKQWEEKEQQEFLDFCTGVKGVKLLYDSFFKEIMNPEYVPERVNDFLSLLLQQKVKVLAVLPNDSTRIADEKSLLITEYLHYFEAKSNTGLELNLIQKYLFVPLDIFKKIRHDKGINGKLEAWLTFLGSDEPEDIVQLVTEYPEFKAAYEEVYNLCLNTEKVMGIFSEELQILDQNTAQLMVEEMQQELYKKYRTVNLANKLLNCRQELINYCNQQTYLLKQIVYFNKQADEIEAKITPA